MMLSKICGKISLKQPKQYKAGLDFATILCPYQSNMQQLAQPLVLVVAPVLPSQISPTRQGLLYATQGRLILQIIEVAKAEELGTVLML